MPSRKTNCDSDVNHSVKTLGVKEVFGEDKFNIESQ
jgi:hypothetical protein